MAGLIGSIGSFDESIEQWSAYTERFDYFVLANEIKVEAIVPTFLTVMGVKTFNLLRSLTQPDKPGDKSYQELVSLLKEHNSPKPLIIAERFRFHKRNQQGGESISQFVAVLKRLSEHCEFGQSLSDTLRDRLVCGLRRDEQGYWVTPLLDGTPVRMQVDTGAAVSLVSETAFKEMIPHRTPQPSNITLKTYTEPAKVEIFYFKEVDNSPVTAAQVKKHTRTDPVMSKVLDLVLRGEYITPPKTLHEQEE
ncbi:hypothetical protein QQF64_013400 [Cirrhinus molitorella]|uniref:Uncharacterized protein n=1 Tax=Cirrhinus molitorella TaxID=172907 RepID=A0ABR3LUD2_9TELE